MSYIGANSQGTIGVHTTDMIDSSTIRVAGHTIAEHDIVNDKVDIKNATLASSNTNNIEVIGFSKQVATAITSSGILTFNATNAFINGMIESSGTITIQKAGKYFAFAQLNAQTSTTSLDQVQFFIRVNTSNFIASGDEGYASTAGGRRSISAGGILNLAVNDNVDFYGSITGSSSAIFSGSESICTLFYLGQ